MGGQAALKIAALPSAGEHETFTAPTGSGHGILTTEWFEPADTKVTRLAVKLLPPAEAGERIEALMTSAAEPGSAVARGQRKKTPKRVAAYTAATLVELDALSAEAKEYGIVMLIVVGDRDTATGWPDRVCSVTERTRERAGETADTSPVAVEAASKVEDTDALLRDD